MLRTFLIPTVSIIFLFGLSMSMSAGFALAQEDEDNVSDTSETVDNGGGSTNSGGGNTNNGGGNVNPGPPGQLTNPLQSQSIETFLLKIIDVILVFALPIIILYIMYAGYLFVTARGDTGQIEEARTALLYSIVGGVIVLGARLIISVIQGTIQSF